MFQNVNKHWRAHLERLFEVVIWRAPPMKTHGHPTDTQWTPVWPPQQTPTEPQRTQDGALMDPWRTQLLWIFSSNGLSKWALQCLFTFWNIIMLDCNSNYLALYSILSFDTNVYNESWLTYYYQWLEPWNGSTRYYHWLDPAISCTNYDQTTMINETW